MLKQFTMKIHHMNIHNIALWIFSHNSDSLNPLLRSIHHHTSNGLLWFFILVHISQSNTKMSVQQTIMDICGRCFISLEEIVNIKPALGTVQNNSYNQRTTFLVHHNNKERSFLITNVYYRWMINMGHASFFMSISKMFTVQIVTFLDTNKRIEYNVAFKIKIYPLMLLGKNHQSHFIVCTEFFIRIYRFHNSIDLSRNY